MSVQTEFVDANKSMRLPPPNNKELFYDSRCDFVLTSSSKRKLRQLAATKRYKSTSVLIRDIIEQHLKSEGL
jgi:hypothetical protein